MMYVMKSLTHRKFPTTKWQIAQRKNVSKQTSRFFCTFMLYWLSSTFGTFLWIGYITLLLVEGLSYSMVTMSLKSMIYTDVVKGYWFDAMGFALILHFLAVFTDWAWLLSLAVPGYLIYWVGRRVLNWVFTPTAEELAEEEGDGYAGSNRRERRQIARKNARRY